MSRHLWRAIAVLTVLTLALAACGNSKKDAGDSGTTTTTTAAGGSTATTAKGGGEANRNTFKSISGVPGVTDTQITYAMIGTKSNNLLGNCIFDCYLAGIKAYFAYRNSEGGIYGRKLVVGQQLDDELGQNQVRALEVTSGKKAFGVFEATLLASGWGDLDKAGLPAYAWGINAAEAANRSRIFPSLVLGCIDCTGRRVPYMARLAGAKRVAAIGYGVNESSKACTNATAKSVEMYSAETGAELAYTNADLKFGLPNGIGPEVSAMKRAGVDFISTCIDLNGMKTLGQELRRQGMQDVVLYHPNSYDQKFVASAGGIFEGDYVSVQFLPFEANTTGSALVSFLKWMKKQGSQPTELAMTGWINATLAFEGLLAAGPEFNQAKVTDATNAMTAFDADGLIQPIDWTTEHTPYTQATRGSVKGKECMTNVQVKSGKFVLVGDKNKPWLCWPDVSTKWSEPVPTSFG